MPATPNARALRGWIRTADASAALKSLRAPVVLTQKKLLAAKIERAMVRQKMTQVELAKAMRTSRTVVHRLLDPHDTSVTLATLAKASKALGVRLVQVA
jgi:antitoxin HicB